MNTQKAFVQLGSLDELNPESMPMKCVYYVQQPGAKEKQPRPLPRRMRVFGWSRYRGVHSWIPQNQSFLWRRRSWRQWLRHSVTVTAGLAAAVFSALVDS